MPGEERRALILRAAGRAFARDGYAGTRLDDVAAAAGVTKPMVYRHFASKKALYMALLEQARGRPAGLLRGGRARRPALDSSCGRSSTTGSTTSARTSTPG